MNQRLWEGLTGKKLERAWKDEPPTKKSRGDEPDSGWPR